MCLAACGPATEQAPRAATPAPETVSPAAKATDAPPQPDTNVSAESAPSNAADAVTLVDPGKPPHELLRYELAPGSMREFRVAHRLTLFDGDQPRGSIEVEAPLSVTTEAPAAAADYALSVQLGPVQITREGDTDAFDATLGAPGSGGVESTARLLARVHLSPSGTIQRARVEAPAGREALLLYETLISLDVPPAQAVGAGARWVAEQSHQGSARTRAEYELVELRERRATFRVQRQQLEADASQALQASGEWTFARDAWPPTGHDQVTETLAEARPGARFSVRFTVVSGAEAARAVSAQTP